MAKYNLYRFTALDAILNIGISSIRELTNLRKMERKTRKLTDYERGYIEGVIDSEGSISIRKIKAKRNTTGIEYERGTE